jgi:hypothetical protein
MDRVMKCLVYLDGEVWVRSEIKYRDWFKAELIADVGDDGWAAIKLKRGGRWGSTVTYFRVDTTGKTIYSGKVIKI